MELQELIEGLSESKAYPEPVDSVELRQTHISLVFLAGRHAYKIKKPVDLGFVDYTTLERRRHFCEEEVRLNRRLAPSVYLGVVPVTCDGDTDQDGGCGGRCRMGRQDGAIAGLGHAGRTARSAATSMPIRFEELARRLARFHAER